MTDMAKIVDVFNKLMRRCVASSSSKHPPSLTFFRAYGNVRYKYLQKAFEESSLKGIMQYANKFTPIEQEKLATSVAIFVASGLASASVLSSLNKDHLVKDCSCSLCILDECLTYSGRLNL